MKGTAKGSGHTQVQTLNAILRLCALLSQARHQATAVSPMLALEDRERFESMRANLSSMHEELSEFYEANIESALEKQDEEGEDASD